MDISLNDLRMKQVVNIYDGKSLGHICDVIFDDSYGKLLGFVVPGIRRFINIFKTAEDVFIPYQNICKIGIDIILVELIPNSVAQANSSQSQNAIQATNFKTN